MIRQQQRRMNNVNGFKKDVLLFLVCKVLVCLLTPLSGDDDGMGDDDDAIVNGHYDGHM